jgi:hypothetical protein
VLQGSASKKYPFALLFLVDLVMTLLTAAEVISENYNHYRPSKKTPPIVNVGGRFGGHSVCNSNYLIYT